jgi:cyclopropane fatty-acyl-phospholipid synthase-like methyltransferase
MGKEWFDTWFDSEYYHLLYKNRNDDEAQLFINNIVTHLGLQQGQKVFDLACGKGRHSMMLNQLGLDVIGADLSENSITYAKQFENETLQFFVHDMRSILRSNYFDVVMNCFTSFGYFKHRHHNELVAQAMVNASKKNGKIVIDFINSIKGEASIKAKADFEIIEGNTTFHVFKKLENGYFLKDIAVHDANKPVQHFSESVQAFYLQDFIDLFDKAGATLLEYFGDYQLHKFTESTSPRLIMVFEKR